MCIRDRAKRAVLPHEGAGDDDVVDVGGGSPDRVHRAASGVHADRGLVAGVPVPPLPGLAGLRISPALRVSCGARRLGERGIRDRAPRRIFKGVAASGTWSPSPRGTPVNSKKARGPQTASPEPSPERLGRGCKRRMRSRGWPCPSGAGAPRARPSACGRPPGICEGGPALHGMPLSRSGGIAIPAVFCRPLRLASPAPRRRAARAPSAGSRRFPRFGQCPAGGHAALQDGVRD